MESITLILLLPFIGTTLGAACVYLMRGQLPFRLQKGLIGFAAGVMVAASIWSLLIPAMEMYPDDNVMRVVPASVGFIAGILFLLVLDRLVPHQHLNNNESEGPRSALSKNTKLALAVTLHNIPEGIAVGVTLAGVLENSVYISLAGAFALSLGIAIQNFPEGAIVSMPLHTDGVKRHKAFGIGVLSGVVEPVAAIITILLAEWMTPALPYLLAFAAGAMIYVVVEELIPETQEGRHSDIGTLGFSAGFVLMMILDTVLG